MKEFLKVMLMVFIMNLLLYLGGVPPVGMIAFTILGTLLAGYAQWLISKYIK